MTLERTGPLTRAQQEWLTWVPLNSPASYADNLHGLVPAPDLPIDAARAAIHAVIARHEGLRSTVAAPGRDGFQHVHALEAMPDDVIVATDDGPLGATYDAFKRTAFRLGEQWPARFVLFRSGDRVRRIGYVIDHAAGDGWAVRVLEHDLAAALRGSVFEGVAEQPVDVALAEAAPAAAVRHDRALGFWRSQLVALREGLADTPVPPAARPDSQYPSCWVNSPAAARAAADIASANGVSVSAVYLWAFGAAVCAVEASPVAGAFLVAADRMTPASLRSVRLASRAAPVALPAFGADRAAADLAAVAAASMRAYRFVNTDPFATPALIEEHLGPVGRSRDTCATFNFIDVIAPSRATVGVEVSAGAAVTHLPPTPQGPPRMLHVRHGGANAMLRLHWRDDTGWGRHAEAMLRFIENLLVWLAGGEGPAPMLGEDRR
jgi:hypothetical protein